MIDFWVNNISSFVCQYDNLLILLLAVGNASVWVITRILIGKVEKQCNPSSDKVNGVNVNMNWSKDQISNLQKIERKSLFGYTFYSNITAIFPLLGILGTVAALYTYTNETMIENFNIALSTTILGVFFAIIFKAFDSLISPRMDYVVESVERIVHDFNGKGDENNEASKN